MLDLRKRTRSPAAGSVRVNWRTAEGYSFAAVARCLDLSRGGAMLELERAIPIGTLVQIESREFRIAGLAMARHCRPAGMRFRVGLEFASGLQWDGAAPSKRD